MKEKFILLLNLYLVFRVQAIRESTSMKSLSCYNDYNSQVTCTWMEHSEAHALVGMSLYRRDNATMENKKMLCKRQTENDLHGAPDSYVHWLCHTTTESLDMGVDYIYSFKPNKTLQAELNVDLFQNVQTLPPKNLSVQTLPTQNLSVQTLPGKQPRCRWMPISLFSLSVLPPVVLPAMFPALIITFLIVAYCSYKYFLRKKQMWEEKIPNPGKSLLIQSYLGEAASQRPAILVGFSEQNTSEEVEQINPLKVLNGMTQSPAEVHGTEAKKGQFSPATLAPQNSCQTSEAPHKTSLLLSMPVYPLDETAGPPCLFARLPGKSAASQRAIPCFAFNGPYLYSPVMSSQPDMHQTLEADPVGVREKSVSLQHVTLPKEDCPLAPQRQEQPGTGPPQPFLLPEQKEMMQHLNNEQEVSPAPPATPPPPPLVPAGDVPCDSQEPQPPSDHPCHEFCPGKTAVMVPVADQAPTSPPELHLDTSGDPLGLHGHSEPTKMSLHVF
ncbi:cytokine receptor common subunit beta-like [Egretta garzetta]|uniref:cytokine receptor common subunit beta-like n=1 Tax=Egretta garzetta TaxID=188379 RepID=UPI00163C6C34|nr:cytokine receptor common subunit beta-like [Egretta garzetta]